MAFAPIERLTLREHRSSVANDQGWFSCFPKAFMVTPIRSLPCSLEASSTIRPLRFCHAPAGTVALTSSKWIPVTSPSSVPTSPRSRRGDCQPEAAAARRSGLSACHGRSWPVPKGGCLSAHRRRSRSGHRTSMSSWVSPSVALISVAISFGRLKFIWSATSSMSGPLT